MSATWHPVEQLTAAERSALYQLLTTHFEGVTPTQFATDLANKTHVIRLWDHNRVVGFSSFAYQRITIAGIDSGAVWSGDTIVDPGAWSSAQLPAAWLAAVLDCHAERGPFAWCLICSGVRTWRMLPVFYRTYVPGTADESLIAVRDQLTELRYGTMFNKNSGIVTLPAPQCLRPHLRDLPEHLQIDAQTKEFINRNPGYQAGDELACATWIAPDNLTAAGTRIWRLAQRLRCAPSAPT